MGTKTRAVDGHGNRIGPLGWFAMAGFLSMGALYFVDMLAEGGIVSPIVSLPIGIVAGVGVLLFWLGNDPTAGYVER